MHSSGFNIIVACPVGLMQLHDLKYFFMLIKCCICILLKIAWRIEIFVFTYQGLGSPVFDKLEAQFAKALLSLPATKGFEFGSGFAG